MRRIFAALLCAVMLLVGTVPAYAAGDAGQIYAAIDEYVTPIGAVGDARREPLVQLGAIPDGQTLAQLPVEPPIRYDGQSIDDLADLQAAFADELDIFGIAHEVEAEDGTYQVYEVIVLDRSIEDSILSSFYMADGLFEKAVISRENRALADRADDLTWRTALGKMGEGMLNTTGLRTILRVGDVMIRWINGETLEETLGMSPAVTQKGHSKNYRIVAQIYPMMHYLYVRGGENDAWVHTATLNRVYAWENHSYTVAQNDGMDGDSQNAEHYLAAEQFDTRLADAVAYYRSNRDTAGTGVYIRMMPTYTASAVYDDEIIAQVETPLPALVRPSDLVRTVRRVVQHEVAGHLAALSGRLIPVAAAFLIAWIDQKRRKAK